jgi:hypothetical protein
LAVFFVKRFTVQTDGFLSFKAYIVVSDTSLLIVILDETLRHTGLDVLLTFLVDYSF